MPDARQPSRGRRKLQLALVLLAGCAATAARSQDDSSPDAALLEFLADWELDSGDWIAPEEVAGLQLPVAADSPPPQPSEQEDNHAE